MTRRAFTVGAAVGAASCITTVKATQPRPEGPVRVTFVGGPSGGWRVTAQKSVAGAALGAVSYVDRLEGPAFVEGATGLWQLTGVRSNERYATRAEHDRLAGSQAGLGRPEATRACLIPMSKSQAWWALSQDERRELFEAKSRHVGIGARYLPAIARRLYHGHDLGAEFDFLTWFEFAPEHEPAFDALLAELRATEEWTFVSREVEVRLSRSASSG